MSPEAISVRVRGDPPTARFFLTSNYRLSPRPLSVVSTSLSAATAMDGTSSSTAANAAAQVGSQLPFQSAAASANIESDREAHLESTGHDSHAPTSTAAGHPSLTNDAQHSQQVPGVDATSSIGATGAQPASFTGTTVSPQESLINEKGSTRTGGQGEKPVALPRAFSLLFSHLPRSPRSVPFLSFDEPPLTSISSTATKEEKVEEKKGKKAKKEKVDYSRSPIEWAMDNPELAGLKPEHRRVIAEQMCVVFLPFLSLLHPVIPRVLLFSPLSLF
jgi:hypothetical protein